MRVLVTGAYGLIGSAILARLHRDGHELVGAGRAVERARRQYSYAEWRYADFSRLTHSEMWEPLLQGIDGVVNCVGVLQDGAGDNTRRVHVDATVALFDACVQTGVRRVVHISAIGSDPQGATAFARTKAQADAHLEGLREKLDWIILRPALVLSSAAYGGTALLRGIAAFPLVMPLSQADSRIQVVGVGDVADTVGHCLAPEDLPGMPFHQTFDLAHPQVHTLGDIAAAMRAWLGFSLAPIVRMPRAVDAIVTVGADMLGLLGWRSPLRSTAFAQLKAGVVGDPADWMLASCVRPKSLADILAERPASVQERWFARLYLLKPIAIASLALFWIATGMIALGPGRTAAIGHLTHAGFSPWIAALTVDCGALLDIVLGAFLCLRKFARTVLLIMLVVTPFYLLAGTIIEPHLWIDPLGALTKIIPMLVATAFTLAILDDR